MITVLPMPQTLMNTKAGIAQWTSVSQPGGFATPMAMQCTY